MNSGREMVGLRLGARLRPPTDALTRAVQAAQGADVAIVVIGYDGGWESEGADRPHMDLPGDQDELVRAVAAANPRTIAVVNAGAPVALPWADEVAGIVQLWFPGMEGGNALADVLFGDVDATDRLPTTFPRRLEDSPAYRYYPGENGVVRYAEGLLVGYRHYDRADIAPRFCFGHGLSYTRFEYADLVASTCGSDVQVSVDVTNVGDRPGQTRTVTFGLRSRAFAQWAIQRGAWTVSPGERENPGRRILARHSPFCARDREWSMTKTK